MTLVVLVELKVLALDKAICRKRSPLSPAWGGQSLKILPPRTVMYSFAARLRHNRSALGIPDPIPSTQPKTGLKTITEEARQVEALLVEKHLSLEVIQGEISELEERLHQLNCDRQIED